MKIGDEQYQSGFFRKELIFKSHSDNGEIRQFPILGLTESGGIWHSTFRGSNQLTGFSVLESNSKQLAGADALSLWNVSDSEAENPSVNSMMQSLDVRYRNLM